MHITPDHKNFIETQMKALQAYDDQRPQDRPYRFVDHSHRVAQDMKALALAMGYEAEMAEALYWVTLPHDIGKMSLPVVIWDLPGKPTEDQKAQRRTHTWRGVEIVNSHFGDDTVSSDPLLTLMTRIMQDHHEALDGSGTQGKTSENLPEIIRMACICDAFDGYSIPRPHFGDRDISPKAVITRMRVEKTGQFDPDILNLFEKVKT